MIHIENDKKKESFNFLGIILLHCKEEWTFNFLGIILLHSKEQWTTMRK